MSRSSDGPSPPRRDEDDEIADVLAAAEMDDFPQEDNEDEELSDEMEEYQDQGEDDGTELVVLDPDHPLMHRFQNALKNMLTRQLERTQGEVREGTEAAKKKRQVHLELGNELYNVQQELAKHQLTLEQHHDRFAAARQSRQQEEAQLEEMRRLYQEGQARFTGESKNMSELRREVDSLALRIFYMQQAREDVRGDIAVMRRAAEKVDVELHGAEKGKLDQDLLVDRLVARVDRLREEMGLYDAQLTAQSEERTAAVQTLRDAQLEIQAIRMERKQLVSQWNSSLIGLQRRNEAYAAILEALNEKKECLLSLDTEYEGYKKSISQEQEQNEKLTLIFNKTEGDIATVKKLLTQSQSKHEALKQKYSTYTRMLHETESALVRASADKQSRGQEVEALRKQIEREFQARVHLEDQITEEMRTRLTLKKAAEYVSRLTGKLKDQSREMEAQLAMVENELSRDALLLAHTKSQTSEVAKQLVDLDKEIETKNTMIGKLEAEIAHNIVTIERRQGTIDQLNKKLEVMIAMAGGVELGPLEITINSLVKSIASKQEAIEGMEQLWLRDQQELVRLVNEKEDLARAVNRLRKQLTILSQKKMRIEGEIEAEIRDKCDVERDLRHLQNDMVRLNGLIFREKDTQENLDKGNILVETDFVRALREQEMDSLQLKIRMEDLKEEKERLLNYLVEAERQIMLWEKKIQLGQETRAAVDSDVGQGEIKAMRSEIHRMEVRFSQLMRQQERLIQDMEKAVSRRDTIATRGEAQQKMKHKVITKGTMQKQLSELRKKIKQTVDNANECEQDIAELRAHQHGLTGEITDRQNLSEELQHDVDGLNAQLQQLADNKHVNMIDLQQKQQTARYLEHIREGKYRPLLKSAQAVRAEIDRQSARTRDLHLVLDRLTRDYPQVQRDVAPLRQLVAQRLQSQDGTDSAPVSADR